MSQHYNVQEVMDMLLEIEQELLLSNQKEAARVVAKLWERLFESLTPRHEFPTCHECGQLILDVQRQVNTPNGLMHYECYEQEEKDAQPAQAKCVYCGDVITQMDKTTDTKYGPMHYECFCDDTALQKQAMLHLRDTTDIPW